MPCSLSPDNLAIQSVRPRSCRPACLLGVFVFRVASVPSRSVPVLVSVRYRPVPSSLVFAPLFVLPGGGGRAAVFACLLRSVRSVSVSSLSSACFVCHVACGCSRCPTSSIHRHVGTPLLASSPSCPYRLRPVPRAVPLPVSLRFVIRPVFRHGGRGDVLRRLSSAGSSLVLVACRPWGVVSAWRVIIMGRSRRAGVLCGLRGVGGCLPFLWYIGIVNWLYISFDWFFDMAGLPAATVIGFECSLIDNAILIEIGGGELPILEPDKAIKYAGLAASRIADFVLAHDYRIPDYLKAAVFLDDGNPRLARAIRFVVDSLRVP